MRDNKINYVVVGAFVIAMLAALLVSIATLTGRGGTTEPYYAVYSNVSGLVPGTRVQYEGFQVGQVDRIEPVRDGSETRFRVWLAVREGWGIPTDSVARIVASGLLSAVAIDIKGGSSDLFIAPGNEIPAGKGGNLFAVMSEVASDVADLSQSSLKPLLQSLNTQVDAVGGILRERAPELMDNLIAVSTDLAQKTPEITQNMKDFSADLSHTGDRLTEVLDTDNVQSIEQILLNVNRTTANFAQLAADMQDTRQRLDRILVTLDQVVAGSKGDMDATMADLRRTMSTLQRSVSTIGNDLEGAARNLNEFSREVRRNPTNLLRSAPADERPGGRR